MLWIFFQQETNLFADQPKRMLHIAPEPCFAGRLSCLPAMDYLSAGLVNPAIVQMDIMDIQFLQNSFDIIDCSHVLEHIPQDRIAMKELARVLKPSGWAILQVPMSPRPTYEDPSMTDPEERTRLFGQSDHVHQYGPDYKDRLEDRILKYRLLIMWKSLMLLIVSFMGSAGLKMIFIIAKCKSNSGLNCSLNGFS